MAHEIRVTFGEAEKGTRDLLDTAESGKQDRREVGYRAAEEPDKVCRLCDNWQGDDQDTEAPCAKVGGEVEAGATCDLFTAAGESDVPPPGGVSDEETDEHEPD